MIELLTNKERILKNNPEQLDLFFEHEPDFKEKFQKARFQISILGGDEFEDDARTLGYELTKEWFSITTGGYNMGAMKAALEGASAAIEDIKKDPKNNKILSFFQPIPQGVVAADFMPKEGAVDNRNVEIISTEGRHSAYLRLGKLIEDSRVCVILPGGTGTDVEVVANLHFNKKLSSIFNVLDNHLIFIGNHYPLMLEEKFKNIVLTHDSVHQVQDVQEAVKLTKSLFEKEIKI